MPSPWARAVDLELMAWVKNNWAVRLRCRCRYRELLMLMPIIRSRARPTSTLPIDSNAERNTRQRAVEALSLLEDTRVVGPLILTLIDNSLAVQQAVVKALRRIGSPEALKALQWYKAWEKG